MATVPSPGNTSWIIVADESTARIFAQEKKFGPLREVAELHNEDARKKTGDMLSDRGGRSFDSHGQGRHTMSREKANPKTQTAVRFAKKIVSRVDNALQKGTCKDFAIIAAPKFLGCLRDAIATADLQAPFLTIDKSVVKQNIADIEQLLAANRQ